MTETNATYGDETQEEANAISHPMPMTTPEQFKAAGVTPESLAKYVHKFSIGGEVKPDLTVKGYNLLANVAGITIENCEIKSEDEDSITVEAIAVAPSGRKYFGIFQEPKKKGGNPNPFYLQNAYSKAQRNAQKGCIPVELVLEASAIATGKSMGDVSELEGKLETARSYYEQHVAEIRSLKATNEELRAEIVNLKGTPPTEEETE